MTSQLADVIGYDDRASQPTPTTGTMAGSLYFVTDELTWERWNGSAWETADSAGTVAEILSIPTAEMDDALVLAPDGAGGVEFRAEAGGGGGVSWVQDASEDGSSFANFTSSSGTWASNGTQITQTDGGGSWERAKYNTVMPLGFGFIAEVEAQMLDDGRAGLLLYEGTTGGGLSVVVNTNDDVINIDRDAIANIGTIAATIGTSTWYKLRIVCVSSVITVYLDGTLKGSFTLMKTADWVSFMQYIGLASYACSAQFRNFKVWTLSGGAPA
jgi:hypothetical protein